MFRPIVTPGLLRFFSISLVLVLGLTGQSNSEDAKATKAAFSIVNHGTHLDMFHDGKHVTTYHKLSGHKPILWPILSPEGYRLTRDYPMVDTTEGEIKDHIHHRSVWFTHGEVNGVDFWGEEGKNPGRVALQEIDSIDASDSAATIKASSDWINSDGTILLKERVTIALSKFESAYVLDYDTSLTSLTAPIHFGDTKEGTFGVRVAESIRVEAGKGGRILNSDGEKNDAAWGRSANWVDYSGPVTKQSISTEGAKTSQSQSGITVFYHPTSLRAPGRWHVRGYGLFAHNPFGEKDFLATSKGPQAETEASRTATAGGYDMKPGETVRFRYSVLLHDSDWTPEFAERYWKLFSKQ